MPEKTVKRVRAVVAFDIEVDEDGWEDDEQFGGCLEGEVAEVVEQQIGEIVRGSVEVTNTVVMDAEDAEDPRTPSLWDLVRAIRYERRFDRWDGTIDDNGRRAAAAWLFATRGACDQLVEWRLVVGRIGKTILIEDTHGDVSARAFADERKAVDAFESFRGMRDPWWIAFGPED
jgi:hypothetical protein